MANGFGDVHFLTPVLECHFPKKPEVGALHRFQFVENLHLGDDVFVASGNDFVLDFGKKANESPRRPLGILVHFRYLVVYRVQPTSRSSESCGDFRFDGIETFHSALALGDGVSRLEIQHPEMLVRRLRLFENRHSNDSGTSDVFGNFPLGIDDFIEIRSDRFSNGIVRSVEILDVPAVVRIGNGPVGIRQSDQGFFHFPLIGKQKLALGFPNGIRDST